jgi:NarL family two-component system response regulator LiaR
MAQQKRIRILIIDDHAMVRLGLSVFLREFDDLELVGEASSGAAGHQLCAQTRPDVVLMDLLMPGMTGVEATRIIRETCPDTQVIVITSFGKEDLVKAALQAGAIGYLFKDVSADELARAIRAAAEGQPTLAKEALQALIASTPEPVVPSFELTESERKVLVLMRQGLNNVEIADHLGVSRSTIKTHVSNILSKMGVGSRLEAVTLALKHGLIA